MMEKIFGKGSMKRQKVRVYLPAHKKMVALDEGYSITYPKDGNPYISIAHGQEILHAEEIMPSVSLSPCSTIPFAYSGDIVAFYAGEKFYGCGIIGFDGEKQLWAIQSMPMRTITPLYECKVTKLLGNVWENPDVIENHQYAALEEPIPGIDDAKTLAKKSAALKKAEKMLDEESVVSVYCDYKEYEKGTYGWSYLLETCHRKKTDSNLFHQKNKDPFYYALCSLIIALDKIRGPRTIRLYSDRKALVNMINHRSLEKMEQAGWTVGPALSPFLSELQTLKKIIDSLGGMVYAYDSKEVQRKLNFTL